MSREEKRIILFVLSLLLCGLYLASWSDDWQFKDVQKTAFVR